MSASERVTDPARVVYVTASLPYGGSEHFVVPEIDELIRQGIDVIVCPRQQSSVAVTADRRHLLSRTIEPRLFSPAIAAAAVRELARSPLRVVRAIGILRESRSRAVLAKNLAVVPKALWLARYVREHGVRHVHAHWASTTATLAMLASEVSGVPFSITAHRWDIAEDNLLAAKVRTAAFVREIDRLGAEELAARSRAGQGGIGVLHMGVALPGLPVARELHTPPVVVIPAGLVEIKGHVQLVEAIALLAERGTRVTLEIVGEGPERGRIERAIERRKVSDRVVMRGFVAHDEVLSEFAAGRFDIAVLASAGTAADAREGIPVALMEALAAGVPAVATRMGGIPELLGDGAGVLVPERDPAALADGIERLITDKAFRAATIAAGEERVRTEFSIEPICRELARRFVPESRPDQARAGGRVSGPRRAGMWPEGKKFAFTIFDDTDLQTVANGAPVYEFLTGLGMRITKSVWMLEPDGMPDFGGESCEDPAYLAWVRSLAAAGHEIAIHGASSSTSTRERTLLGLERFRETFGENPRSYANHAGNRDGLYHGDARVSGWRRPAYNVLTRGRRRNCFTGHVPGSPLFWGDLCRERVTYVRNFVYGDINTLKACPYAPYHDAERPFVQFWFASAEGSNPGSFARTISEANQQRLEDERGLCIMYTHLGAGFYRSGRLDPEFERLMRRLAQRDGWFAPVSTVLDHMRATQGDWELAAPERAALERRWLLEKVRSHKTS